MVNFHALGQPFIIGEAGTNHAHRKKGKRLDNALRYVQCAKDAGADCVKFQMFNSPIKDDFFCYIDGDEERSKRWDLSVMPLEDWSVVKDSAESLGIDFLASAFQHSTVAWLNDLGVIATKVASRATRDFPYENAPAPFFVSNGMYPIPDRDDVIGFQCEANYPSLEWWRGDLPGFSDHSGNPSRALHAIKQGCKLVEVHFFDDPEDAGPDLSAAMDTGQLQMLCMGAG